ncbi:bifunctional 2',3'-cyclic-nucleotide 2'-phosphodiesterase/3'-nucleotidase [Roseovarius arcticus]|uniref:bifunctional 2',3'-cyclic-nucleotide 2'-phosphodiesterase/3'-nucleotidase n=1 Tax=Roseovarius arcticus TaxID=2547404 RepID=UPI001110EB6F|nr:bifunctional 2',3'-cyclic-nucleotide 2'-phosphodiesterase/3'-nucleotidase [Roseovarius arcticus]
MILEPPPQPDDHEVALPEGVTAQLRLLETTDLHAHLLPYDYHSDNGDQPWGLARVATLIRAARAQVRNVMLFDNGDALQGTPMGDLTTGPAPEWRGPNPVIAAMNRLNYDAATLGNHEFNFGLNWLGRALGDATFPVTCANIMTPEGATPARSYLPQYLLLRRTLACDDGAEYPLTLGVIGLVPPQITTWDHAHLAGQLHVQDMIQTARRIVPQVRAAGADIVLLLAHSGIDGAHAIPMMENAAVPLAAIEGVDAIMAGHSHDIFPQPEATGNTHSQDTMEAAAVDHARGVLSGKPAVMAGAWGSHLGVLDLSLEARGGRWRISGHTAEARPVASVPGPPATRAPVLSISCDADLSRALGPAHRLTLRHMHRPIGQARARLHSYLAMARADASVAAVNAVQTRLLARALQGTAHEGLPILSATAAFKTGGRGGPNNFTDLPEGPLSLRHAADLYPFPNHLCGMILTGADLRDWLERAAICFATVRPGAPEAMLRDYSVPGHDFDVISGLTYRIDLSAAPRYDRHGAALDAAPGVGAGRIQDLCYNGLPLAADARFALATNSYRAFGAGAFTRPDDARIVHVSDTALRDDLVAEIAHTPLAAPAEHTANWRFVPLPGSSVLLDTGKGLRTDPSALDDMTADDLGLTPAGFQRLRIWL